MGQELLLRQVRIFGADGSLSAAVDVRIADGHIAEITAAGSRADAIDLQGAYLLPGFIDAQPCRHGAELRIDSAAAAVPIVGAADDGEPQVVAA